MAVNSITAFTVGDPSVGLQPQAWTIEEVGDLDNYPGQREDVRAAFMAAFMMMTDDGDPIRVLFDDELR